MSVARARFERPRDEGRQKEMRRLARPRMVEAPGRDDSQALRARRLQRDNLLRGLARRVDAHWTLRRRFDERQVLGSVSTVLLAASDDDDDRVKRSGIPSL